MVLECVCVRKWTVPRSKKPAFLVFILCVAFVVVRSWRVHVKTGFFAVVVGKRMSVT